MGIGRPAAWVIAGVVLILAACVPDYLEMLREGWSGWTFGNDYQYYYVSGYMVAHGDLRCYQPPVISAYSRQLTQGLRDCIGLYQIPMCVLLCTVLSFSDYFTSFGVFLALNHLLVLLSVALVCLALNFRSRGVIVAVGALAILFPPILETLLRGQINVVALFCLSLYLFAVVRRREGLAATAINLVATLKVFPAVAFLPALFQRRFRLTAMTVGLGLLVLIVPALLTPALVMGYAEAMAANKAFLVNGYRLPFNQSWPAAFDRLFREQGGTPGGHPLVGVHPQLATAATLFMVLGIWVLTLAVLWRRRHDTARLADMTALVVAAVGSAVPYNFVHHHSWLLIPVLVLWLRVDFSRPMQPRTVALWLVTLLLWTADGYCLMGSMPVRLIRFYFVLWGGGTLAATALFALSWLALWRFRPDTP